jgi:hypothetical protein
VANEQGRTAADKMSPRQRQYEVDRITAEYVEERRAGRSPRVEDYARRYPEFARDIRLFVADYLLIGERLPEPDPVPTAPLSSAALAALAQIELESAPDVPIVGLVTRGIERGFEPPRLAAAVGISMDVLGKLDAKAIVADSIPFTLVERLAEKLQAVPKAIAAFLVGAAPAQAPALYYAEQAPEQRQESFLDAIQASNALDEHAKQEWANIVARDIPPA